MLRRLREEDAEGMLEWMHDPDIQKNFCFRAETKKKRDVIEFIRKANIKLTDGESIHFAIADESDEYAGTISLKSINLTAKNAEYAISLRKEAQGKGIAFAATKELLSLAFGEYQLERIYLNVLSENQKAIRFYERCGFVYEGEFRRHLFLRGEFKTLKWFSILKEEYLIMFKGGGISVTYIKELPSIIVHIKNKLCHMEVA